MSATRILLFPELKTNPKIDISKITPTAAVTPTPANSVKTIKASPTP